MAAVLFQVIASFLVLAAKADVIMEKSFEGCFMKPYRHQGRSEFIFDNSNDKCVKYCRDEGFILAATHGSWCHCTQALPRRMLALKGALNVTGAGTACGRTCPGSLKGRASYASQSCSGDECCGGEYRDKDGTKWRAFSVYAVSGIPVVEQIKKRVKSNIDGHHLLWQIFDECGSFEHLPRTTLVGGAPIYRSASSKARCEMYCNAEVEYPCLAYSYKGVQGYDGDCELFRYLTDITDSPDKALSVRRCFRGKEGQRVIPTHLLDAHYTGGKLQGLLITVHKGNPHIAVCHPEDSFKASYNHTATIACREMGFLFGRYLPKSHPRIPDSYLNYNLYCQPNHGFLADCAFHKVLKCKNGIVRLECTTLGAAVTNKVVDLYLENYQRMIQHNPPSHIKAIRETMEQDNRHSSIPQAQSYSETTVISERADITQESGFQRSKETTKTKHEEKSSENTYSTTFSMTNTVTMSASVSFFVSASSSFGISHTIQKTASKSFMDSSSTTSSTTKEETRMFEKGYSASLTNQTTLTYTYHLVVPPHHIGLIAFFEETYPLILMWRAVFKLNGFIKIRLGPLEKEWHVSRLLTQDQRIFFTMNKLNAERKKIVAKVRIKDNKGKTVSVDVDEVKCSSQQCATWYSTCTQRLCDKIDPCLPPTKGECKTAHACLKEPEELIEESDYAWEDEDDDDTVDDLFASLP